MERSLGVWMGFFFSKQVSCAVGARNRRLYTGLFFLGLSGKSAISAKKRGRKRGGFQDSAIMSSTENLLAAPDKYSLGCNRRPIACIKSWTYLTLAESLAVQLIVLIFKPWRACQRLCSCVVSRLSFTWNGPGPGTTDPSHVITLRPAWVCAKTARGKAEAVIKHVQRITDLIMPQSHFRISLFVSEAFIVSVHVLRESRDRCVEFSVDREVPERPLDFRHLLFLVLSLFVFPMLLSNFWNTTSPPLVSSVCWKWSFITETSLVLNFCYFYHLAHKQCFLKLRFRSLSCQVFVGQRNGKWQTVGRLNKHQIIFHK